MRLKVFHNTFKMKPISVFLLYSQFWEKKSCFIGDFDISLYDKLLSVFTSTLAGVFSPISYVEAILISNFLQKSPIL